MLSMDKCYKVIKYSSWRFFLLLNTSINKFYFSCLDINIFSVIFLILIINSYHQQIHYSNKKELNSLKCW